MSEMSVRLRAIAEADLSDYVAWLNDPEVTQFTQIESGGITLEGEREWFARITAPDERNRHWAIELDGRHVGNCALMPDAAGLTAGFGIIIGDKTAWNRGCGTAALREVLRVGFEEMGLHRIHLTALAENARAIRCYQKCGFRHEGLRRRHYLKRGRLVDVVCMGILREEWEEQLKSVGQELAHPERSRGASCPPGLRVRSYRPSDYPQVADLWRAVWSELGSNDTPEALQDKAAHDRGPFLVAELEGCIVGTAMASWDGRWAWISRVAVHPGYQRRGIGRELMAEVERRLAALGAQRAYLITGAESQGATRFYRSLGYEVRDGLTVMRKLFEPRGEECCGH